LTHGVLVVDKPAGLSSAAVVEHVKRTLGVARAGHGGTLDPLATGVLPICLGAATKLAGYLLADDKAYEATGVLGVETDTLDRTGEIIATRDPGGVDRAALERALAARLGPQDQVPPMFSAIKQGGVRLYHRARAGETVEREPRRIDITRLAVLAFAPPRFEVAIECSKGTYVRSLIADLGTDLGCGAHLAELRRTRSGRFGLDQAVTLEALDLARLVPCGRATGLPSVVVPDELLSAIRSGLPLTLDRLGVTAPVAEQFQLVDGRGQLVAITHLAGRTLIYDRVFLADATS
jgi:tRNA pseudouridine55 synthase